MGRKRFRFPFFGVILRLTSKIGFFGAWMALLAGVGAVLRLVALPPLLPDLDSVNFARALDTFDLAGQSPHFPGYPVFVVLARGASLLGLSDVVALSLPGVILAPAAVLALGWALLPRVGAVPALGGAAVVALAPLAVLFGGAPSSDGLGFATLVIAVAAALWASRVGMGGRGEPVDGDERTGGPGVEAISRWLLAGAAAGLMLGARPSYLPAVVLLPLLAPGRRAFLWIGGAAVGVALWLLPLVALTGPATFFTIARGFLGGHMGEWGGTVVVAPDLVERLRLFAFDLGAVGLGLPWAGSIGPFRIVIGLLVVAGLVLIGMRREKTLLKVVCLSTLPYGAWAFVGQNLLKARHALPLLVGAALLVAMALAAIRRDSLQRAGAALWAGALLAVSLPLALTQGREASPAARLVHEVAASYEPEGRMIFTGEEARLFERYAPWVRAGRLSGAEELAAAAHRLSSAGIDVLITSAAPGAGRLEDRLEPLSRYETDRLVRSHANEIVLYRFRPATLAARSAQ